MRILLDECVPKPLKRELLNYEIRTVVEMGWSGKKNGELLQLMQLIALRYTELKDSVSVEACFSINSLFFSKTL